MVDWNAILNLKIDMVGRGASGSGRCESSLIDFMARHDFVATTIPLQITLGRPKADGL